MEYKISKTESGLVMRTNSIINHKKSSIKVILGNNEKDIIKEFVNSINIITIKEKQVPHVFTFNRRDYMSYILSRIIKYGDDIQADGIPLNKWKIEDIRDKFGNYNDEYMLFDYFDLPPIKNKNFYSEELRNSKKEISDFFIQATNKIYNLSFISSKIIDNTYSDNYGPKVVVSFEIEPIREKLEEFKNVFKYLKDESEETLLRYMKNNFIFGRLLGISICKLSDQRVIEEEITQ